MRFKNAIFIGAVLVIYFMDYYAESGRSSSDEYRLLQDLFERRDGGYNPRIRPVENINDLIEVGFEMALIQLINLDERNQIMKTNVWLRLTPPEIIVRHQTSTCLSGVTRVGEICTVESGEI